MSNEERIAKLNAMLQSVANALERAHSMLRAAMTPEEIELAQVQVDHLLWKLTRTRAGVYTA